MAKPAGNPTPKWTGTKGDDEIIVPSLSALGNTTYDGASGYDTLNLSALSAGVSIDLMIGTPGADGSHYWLNRPFSGSWWDFSDRYLAGSPRLDDTLRNFEKIVGTNFNDYLQLRGGSVARVVDGGAGDDAIYMAGSSGTNTAIGGAGSDQLFGSYSNHLLVGGTYVNGQATGDHTGDEFELSAGTILDFEVGLDRIYIDPGTLMAQIEAQSWVNVTWNGKQATQLQIASDRVITLVGVTADTMNAMPKGFMLSGGNGTSPTTVVSTAGDDFIWDSYSSVTVNRFVFADGSGDDVLLGLDLSIDALVFNSAVSWTQSSYHGQASLLGTYDGGNSTVLLVGIASAQQPELMVEAPAGDLLGIG